MNAKSQDTFRAQKRTTTLNNRPENRDREFVLYWMCSAHRIRFNHALNVAVESANRLGLPLVPLLSLHTYPELSTTRHRRFLIQGARDLARQLQDSKHPLRISDLDPIEIVPDIAHRAALLVTDDAHLRETRRAQQIVADNVNCKAIRVETNVVVPVQLASDREEYAARTFRPRIQSVLNAFLSDDYRAIPEQSSRRLRVQHTEGVGGAEADWSHRMREDSTSQFFPGGETEARRRLNAFLETKFTGYAEKRNDPSGSHTSALSPYLRFGHISPMEIVLAARNRAGVRSVNNFESFTDELVVRRELATNFVRFNERYDRFDSLPGWARETLERHASDHRDPTYTLEELEAAETQDPYWNAAMEEMRITGSMKGYMRMYWGKKVLEWTDRPEVAFERLLHLNNSYFLDGWDPNSFANVAWIFGKHDRPWKEREIFGTVRYMNANGLRRKFDIEKYVGNVANLKSG